LEFINHYQTLQVLPNASADAIKKAYHKLALKYHPDIAGDNDTANAKFIEIKAAYDVIGNPQKRQAYHYKYFFKDFDKTKEVFDPNTLLHQANQLALFAESIDPFRVDYDKLTYRIQIILQKNYLLNNYKNASTIREEMIVQILRCTKLLPYKTLLEIHTELIGIAGTNTELVFKIEASTNKQYQLHLWNKYKLLASILLAIALCLIMYFSVTKQ